MKRCLWVHAFLGQNLSARTLILPYNSPTAAINDGRFFHYILIENHNPDGREATGCRNKAPLRRHTKIMPVSPSSACRSLQNHDHPKKDDKPIKPAVHAADAHKSCPARFLKLPSLAKSRPPKKGNLLYRTMPNLFLHSIFCFNLSYLF